TVSLLESAGGTTTQVGTQEVSSPMVSYTFESNMPVTTYVAVVVASAEGFIASGEGMSEEVVTGKGTLAPVSAGQITTSSVTENSITLSWVASNAQANATEYVFTRDGGTEEVIAISAESYEITNLAADTLYTIMVIARGDTNQYNDSSALSIEVRTTPILQELDAPAMVTAAVEVRRQDTATVSDIRVAWGSVANAQRYTVTLYAGADSSGGTPLGNPLSVSAPATTAVFEDQLNNQFFTVGVTAESDIYPNSGESFVSVLPPKLSSGFFTVTPSSASLSLAWNPSFDAVLQDGVNFYDATRVDNFGSSASSLLLISIEDLNGNEITGSAQVSTEENAYSTDGLNEGTDYILKIVQRVTIGSVSLDSETLEIPFRTLEELPEPTEDQISWTANGTTLTVEWDNAAAGVTSYDLTLTRTDGLADTVVGGSIEVNARTTGSTTFVGLTAETTYTLSVVAKGDTALYAPSPQYRVSVITLQLPQLETPTPDQISITAAGDNITVSWDGLAVGSRNGVSTYSISILLTSTVGETNYVVENMAFSALQDGSPVFGNLTQDTSYTVTVIAEGDGASSLPYSFTLETTRQLGTPQVTAVTEDFRRAIKVSWDRVPNAQSYRVRFSRNPDNLLRG
ncbi:MAG: fibronectin type III domain-containing protein, partial [Candidatus Oxydemutatoraceae bacterium WSBS_2016_MAG_OTU14]